MTSFAHIRVLPWPQRAAMHQCVVQTFESAPRIGALGIALALLGGCGAPASPVAGIPQQSPIASSAPRAACGLLSAADVAAVLGGPIGSPLEDDKSAVTACTYPPATGDRQAEIKIDWSGGRAGPITAANSHSVKLGDAAFYGTDGVLSVQSGPIRLTVTLPVRQDSESKAVALGAAVLQRLRDPPASAAMRADAPGLKPLSTVHELTPGGQCTDPGATAAAARAAMASASIPLVKGLTLSHTWKVNADDYEHECLEQIADITASSVLTRGSCPVGPKRTLIHWTRRLCWQDLMDSYLYLPGVSEKDPETFVGSLEFSLSSASLQSLKTRGEVHHRFLEHNSATPPLLLTDVDGILKSDGAGTFKVIVNDRVIEAPTIEASYVNQREGNIIRVKVLNDTAFPLLLDYYVPTEGKFFITYTKISYPTASEVEKHLAVDKRAEVYGIYFDFASDSLRSESEPVLNEIAAALRAHPDWRLTISGHTDNVGDAAQNLDLSRRRAASVRNALIRQFMIDEHRLSTNGYGASQPKESNDTDRGRARNRRVELTRQ